MARLVEIMLACQVLASTSNCWVYSGDRAGVAKLFGDLTGMVRHFGDHANGVGFLEIMPAWSDFLEIVPMWPSFWRLCWLDRVFGNLEIMLAYVAKLLEIVPA